MRLVSFSPKPAQFDSARGLTFINSDLAFGNGHYAYQGNFAGFTVWDVSNPAKPVVASVVECITSQGDPSIVGNLLFVSAEGAGNRNDCGKGGVQDPKDHMTGVRIYDVSNPKRAQADQERADLQRLAHAHGHPEPDGSQDRLHLRVGAAGCAAGHGAGRVQERHGPRRPDELALSARHHQGAARSPRAGRGDPGRADLHRPRGIAGLHHLLRSGGPAPSSAAAADVAAPRRDSTQPRSPRPCTPARATATT